MSVFKISRKKNGIIEFNGIAAFKTRRIHPFKHDLHSYDKPRNILPALIDFGIVVIVTIIRLVIG